MSDCDRTEESRAIAWYVLPTEDWQGDEYTPPPREKQPREGVPENDSRAVGGVKTPGRKCCMHN